MQMPRALPIVKIVDIYNYFALKTVVVYFSFEMLSNRITYWHEKNNASHGARGEKPLILSVVPLKQFNLGLGSVPFFRLKHCNRRSKQTNKQKTLINFISKFKIWTVWTRKKNFISTSRKVKTIPAKEGPCALWTFTEELVIRWHPPDQTDLQPRTKKTLYSSYFLAMSSAVPLSPCSVVKSAVERLSTLWRGR